MRSTLVALLIASVAAVSAGCAAKPGQNPTDTNATPTTTPMNTTMAPVNIKTDDHDFFNPTAPASTAITVPSGVTTLNVTITISPSSPAGSAPAGVAQGVKVTVGGVTCSADGPVTQSSSCKGTTAASGVKSIAYAGNGPVSAHVVVTGT